jgi:predicted nucleic acid-binding protein
VAYVVDASALVLAVLTRDDAARRLRQTVADERCEAPHLIDFELGHAFRRQVLSGSLAADTAHARLVDAMALVGQRHEATPILRDLAWGLRDSVSYYDAAYVALATTLALPLLTADRRLAQSPGLPCAVELVA